MSKLKPSKCSFFSFLGHRITREGVATDSSKTAAVLQSPQMTLDVQGFLGLVSYYRKYVSDFAAIAKPLYWLMEKGWEFK